MATLDPNLSKHLSFDIKREFSCSSVRVKSIDFHSKIPFLLCSLYNGFVQIWNYESNKMEKTIEVTEGSNLPVRCAKFIERKNWFVSASDDFCIRVFNYNTMEKVRQWEAHEDYLRCLIVHKTKPLLVSASDDMKIKTWNWDKDFEMEREYKDHKHYVMGLAFDPNDADVFASASLDSTIKIWSLSADSAKFTLKGHSKGVNCVHYFQGPQKPLLVSGSDDQTVKVWDYSSRQCLATLEGHTANISSVFVHPLLPLIVSVSEDYTIRLWHSRTFLLESVLDYGLDRAWTMAAKPDCSLIAVGFDFGTVVLRLGHERPRVSMDSNGNLVWFKNYSLMGANVRKNSYSSTKEGAKVILTPSEIGNCEVYPKTIEHSPNGRVISVFGDGQYTVSTARTMKSISFGSAKEFVWSRDSKKFAIRETGHEIKIFFENCEKISFTPAFPSEGMFGGSLLGVRTSEFTDFYDWTNVNLVARIPLRTVDVCWSENGVFLAAICKDSLFFYRYDRQSNEQPFEVCWKLRETVTSAKFVGDFCLVFTTSKNALKYVVTDGFEKKGVCVLSQMNEQRWILGYLPQQGKVYLTSKRNSVFAYSLNAEILSLQVQVLQGKTQNAKELLKNVSEKEKSALARFFKSQGHFELALEIALENSQIFDLSLATGDLERARRAAEVINHDSTWKKLSESSIQAGNFEIARIAAKEARDANLLLLLALSLNDKEGLKECLELAEETNDINIAFLSSMYLKDTEKAEKLLRMEKRDAEADLLRRTYVGEDSNGE